MQKVERLRTGIAAIIATACGAGLFPVAPGTMGTVFALPLTYFTLDWSWQVRVLFWTFLTLLGSWAAGVFDQWSNTRDNSKIVIDEVIGLGITAWTIQQESWKGWVVAFVLFRFFDILKLPPVRIADQWSKKQPHGFLQGFAVIADDILAGFQGLAIILILQWFGIL